MEGGPTPHRVETRSERCAQRVASRKKAVERANVFDEWTPAEEDLLQRDERPRGGLRRHARVAERRIRRPLHDSAQVVELPRQKLEHPLVLRPVQTICPAARGFGEVAGVNRQRVPLSARVDQSLSGELADALQEIVANLPPA